MDAEADRLAAEVPVRLTTIARKREVLAEELELRALQSQVRALEVERDLLLEKARQDLRREILPLEQAPRIVESASRILQGASLSVYGDDARLVGQLEPFLDLLGQQVRAATAATTGAAHRPAAADGDVRAG